MTQTEAHSSKDHQRSAEAHRARMALSPADRKAYYAAHRAGDWAEMARLMGEDIGTN